MKKIKQLFQKKNIKENITQNRKFNYVFEKGNLLNQISSTNLRNKFQLSVRVAGGRHTMILDCKFFAIVFANFFAIPTN